MELTEQDEREKQTRNKLIDTENRLLGARAGRVRGLGEKDEGIKKYKLVVHCYFFR